MSRVSLVSYVQKNAKEGDADGVIKAMDKIASKKSLGILDENKGSLLETAVQKFNPLAALELGGSCGYAAIRIALKMTKPNSKLFALELNSARCEAARDIIRHAGLSNKVKMITGATTSRNAILNDELVNQLKISLIEMGAPHFDFIFLDHYPSCYLKDFMVLDKKSMLGKGTGIVANTMGSGGLYNGLSDYMNYLKDHPEELETETYTNNSGSTSITVSTYIVD